MSSSVIHLQSSFVEPARSWSQLVREACTKRSRDFACNALLCRAFLLLFVSCIFKEWLKERKCSSLN
jgi:hypothetical protein